MGAVSSRGQRERAEHRAVRLAVLLMLDDAGLLRVVSDIEMGQALGVDRTTVWRDRRALPRLRKLRDTAVAALQRRLAE